MIPKTRYDESQREKNSHRFAQTISLNIAEKTIQ